MDGYDRVAEIGKALGHATRLPILQMLREVERVNRTWERRSEIAPSTHVRQRPTPLALYKLLPQTNCKQCGEPTCYVFATKLAVGQHELPDCPALAEPSYADHRASLHKLLGGTAS